MHTRFTPQGRFCALIAAVAASVLALSACDRATTDVPTPTTEGTERRDDTTREPAMTPPPPVAPDAPTLPADPATPPGTPPASGGTQ